MSEQFKEQTNGLIRVRDGAFVPKDESNQDYQAFKNSGVIVPPTNSELRKAAMAVLSQKYQVDIGNLNTAWLAVAVSDGSGEAAKKSAVEAQIAARKTQYNADVASLLAQYPS